MDFSSIINGALLLFAVLSLASLAGYFCEKVGIVNIGIDGQMIFGALVFSIFAQMLSPLSNYSFILPILLSAIISVLLSALFGLMTIKLKCDHVIAGTAVNLLMAGLAIFLSPPLGSLISAGGKSYLTPGYNSTLQIGTSSLFGESIILAVIAIIIVAICWFVVNRTRLGLRFKAVGENPNAVDAQGISVNKLKWVGVMTSGVLAAIAGSIFSYAGPNIVGGQSEFIGNVGGLGFLAIAIVVAGSWRIPIIIIMAFAFSVLSKVFDNINQVSADLPITFKYLGRAIPFILSLVTLIIFSKKNAAPRALGQHFDKSLR